VRRTPAAQLLLLVSLAALGAGFGGCKRRDAHTVPAPPAAAEAAEPSAARAPTLSAPSTAPSRDPVLVTAFSAQADAGAPKGYEQASVWDVVPAGDGAAVLLIDGPKTTVLPIFVGGSEALTIRLRVGGERYERPLTHDLLSSLVKELGGSPVKVQIDDQRDDTYFGSVFVRQGDRLLELDARPSDAIAIALGSGAPLYVSRSVMLASGVPRDQIEKEERQQEIENRRKGHRISL
jgi:bifunctional DNase/RNase